MTIHSFTEAAYKAAEREEGRTATILRFPSRNPIQLAFQSAWSRCASKDFDRPGYDHAVGQFAWLCQKAARQG